MNFRYPTAELHFSLYFSTHNKNIKGIIMQISDRKPTVVDFLRENLFSIDWDLFSLNDLNSLCLTNKKCGAIVISALKNMSLKYPENFGYFQSLAKANQLNKKIRTAITGSALCNWNKIEVSRTIKGDIHNLQYLKVRSNASFLERLYFELDKEIDPAFKKLKVKCQKKYDPTVDKKVLDFTHLFFEAYKVEVNQITEFSVTGCGIYLLPESICKLTKLKELDLSGSNLIQMSTNLEELKELNLIKLDPKVESRTPEGAKKHFFYMNTNSIEELLKDNYLGEVKLDTQNIMTNLHNDDCTYETDNSSDEGSRSVDEDGIVH